jgi:hypothetical protein
MFDGEGPQYPAGQTAMSHSPAVSALVRLVAAILAVALFVAGAMWRRHGDTQAELVSAVFTRSRTREAPPAHLLHRGARRASVRQRRFSASIMCFRAQAQRTGGRS